MKRNRISARRAGPVAALAGALVLSLFVPALARDPQSTSPDRERSRSSATSRSTQTHLIEANQLIGRWAVRDPEGANMGRIEDIVLERNSRRIAYAVVAIDPGWLTLEKLYAIPWSKVDVGPMALTVTVDIDRDRLQRAPGFHRDNWPDMANQRWLRATDEAFGTHADDDMWGAHRDQTDSARSVTGETGRAGSITRDPDSPRFEFRRLSELIGTDVENRQAEDLGEIENVLVDDREGRVAYALISRGGFMGIGEELVPVPWHALDLRPWQDKVVVDIDRRTLETLASTRVDPRDLESGKLAQKVHQAFDAEPYWVVYGYTVTYPSSPGRAAGENADYGAAWKQGSAYNAKFDPDRTVRLQGEVLSVGSFRPEPGGSPGLRLRVRADDGRVHTVHAGPSGFLAGRQVYLAYGERVQVAGSRAEVDGRQVVIARTISADGRQVALRDERGRPNWATSARDPGHAEGTGGAREDDPRDDDHPSDGPGS